MSVISIQLRSKDTSKSGCSNRLLTLYDHLNSALMLMTSSIANELITDGWASSKNTVSLEFQYTINLSNETYLFIGVNRFFTSVRSMYYFFHSMFVVKASKEFNFMPHA